MDRNRVIGVGGKMPWHLPDDLKRFRRLTNGGTVVMGRKTFESIGRALPGRRNIVVTHRPDFDAPGCEVVASLDDALREDAFVIGGGEIYAQALPRADRMELTLVDVRLPDGDTYFPAWREDEWRELRREHHPPDARHEYAFDYVTFERR